MAEAASDNREKYDIDVFLVHSEVDDAVTKRIHLELEKKGYRVCAQYDGETFKPGAPIFDSITKAIENSWRTLIVVTEKCLERSSSWVNLETILALEQSKYRPYEDLTLRMILCNVKEEEVPVLCHGQLSVVPEFTINFNKESWTNSLDKSLKKHIKTPDVLPVGSLAHGLVFSHYVGFLSHVLPRYQELVQNTQIYKENADRFSLKYYMLLPMSAKMLPHLTYKEESKPLSIEEVDKVSFSVQHMGKERRMDCSIFKMRWVWQEYYFMADLPNVLNAVHTLDAEELAEVDIRLQMDRFFHTYSKLVNHQDNAECNGKLEILKYNDAKYSHAEVLFKAVKKDVKRKQQSSQDGPSQPQYVTQDSCVNADADVFITCSDDKADREIAVSIQQYLESQNVTVVLDEGILLNEQSTKFKWHIFILTNKALESTEFTNKCFSSLAHSLNEDLVKVLPILKGVHVNRVPSFLNWVTLLSAEDPHCTMNIYNIIKGRPVKMQHRLPAGDVCTGLVWAYFINYLKHVLCDLRGRIQKFLHSGKINEGCICRMYIICPRSCEPYHNVQDKANEWKGPSHLEYLGNLEEVVYSAGGQSRPFKLPVFKYVNEHTRRRMCFITEYCTPLGCMHFMAKKFPFAGLHLEEMYKQGEEFVRTFKEIAHREAVKQKLGNFTRLVQLIYYDDEKEPLMTALERLIDFDHVQDAELVYSEDLQRHGDQVFPLREFAERDEVYSEDESFATATAAGDDDDDDDDFD